MTFPSRGPIGGWQYGDTLSHLAMSYVDSDHVDAVDGVCGGTYALVTTSGSRTGPGSLQMTTLTGKAIVLNLATFPSAADGGGMLLGGEANVDTLVANVGATVNGSVTVTGSVSVPSVYADYVNASVSVNADTVNANAVETDHGSSAADWVVGGRLTTFGPTDLQGAVTAGAGLTVTSGVTSTKNLSVTGQLSVSSNVGVSGQVVAAGSGTFRDLTGRKLLSVAVGGNADATYRMADYDALVLYLGSSTLTADRTYTLDATGAQEGSSMRIWAGQNNHAMIIAGAVPSGLALQYSSGNNIACTAVVIGGVIHLVDIVNF